MVGSTVDDAHASWSTAIAAVSEFADRIDVGLVAHGPDGSIVGANEAACVLLGLTRDQILGRTSTDSRWGAVREDGSPFPGEEHPAMVTLRTGLPCTDVIMGVDATGFERRWLSIRSAAVDLTQVGVGVVALFVDAGDRVQAARALAESRAQLEWSDARFRATVDGLPDPYVVMEAVRDASGVIIDLLLVDANAAACASSRVVRGALIGTRLLDRLSAPVGADLLDGFTRTIETGVPLDLTDYRYEVDGRPYFFDIHAEKLDDGVGCTWRDVTEALARSDALVRTQEMLRTKLDVMFDPLAYLEPVCDDAGRIVDFAFLDANRAMLEFLDASAEELEGSRLRDALPGATESGFLGLCARMHETGEPLVLDGFAFTAATPASVGRLLDVRGTRVADGISLTWREVTDRDPERSEPSVDEGRYRLLAEHTAEAILQIGLDGTIEWASEGCRAVLGWEPDEVAGLRNVDLVHPDDLDWFRVETARLASTGDAGKFTLRVRRADASYCWVEVVSSETDRPGGPPFRVVRLRDVERELEALRRLTESEQRYRLLAENSSDVIVHLVDQRIAWVSPSVERVFGWSPEAVTQVDVADVIHPDDVALVLVAVRRVGGGERVVERVRVRSADGSLHWTEAHGGPYRDADGVLDGVLVTLRIVDAEMAAFLALDRLAHFDPVTGVVNRAEALSRLDERFRDRRRRGPLGVIYCDVDRFKAINDTLGHAVGDVVLRTLAKRLQATVRDTDTVARIGGDEFIVILDGPISLEDATRIAEKLRRAALEVITDSEVAYSTSISIGVTLSREFDDADSVLARADGAMYAAKDDGGNRVVTAT